MTANDFVIWLKGFASAANTYNITPKQWDIICEELEKVNNTKSNSWTISYGKTTDTTYKQDELSTNTVF